MRRYAERTRVPALQTRTEVETMLRKRGASGVLLGTTSDQAMVMFEMCGWRVKFLLPLPTVTRSQSQSKVDAETRRRWRALLLVIKAKLEAVSSNIVAFEREFLPFIVTNAGGQTVADQLLPTLGSIVTSGELPRLLGPGAP